jgi:hypothetical protein
MNDLDIIAWGAGLHDALNPCIFMTCAVFMVYGSWLESGHWNAHKLRGVFACVYALAFFEFNFSTGQLLVFNKHFVFAAKIIYLILGLWSFVLGILALKEWFLLVKCGRHEKSVGDESRAGLPTGRFPVAFLTAAVALGMSALSAMGPINNYILLLAYEINLKGLVYRILPVVAGYIFFSMWPLWLVWAFLSLRTKEIRPSLFKIICASIFFIASSTVVFMFE